MPGARTNVANQFELPGTETWLDGEVVTPKSGRPLTLRYNLVRTPEALMAMRDVLVATRDIAWDTETSGLKAALGARICGHAFAAQTGPGEISCWYVPIRHHLAVNQLPVPLVSQVAVEILTAPGRCGYAHAKFEWQMGRPDGIAATREAHDVLILALIANENEPTFQLKALADKYCLPGARTEEKALEAWMRADARGLGMHYKPVRETDEIGIDLGREPSYLERFGYARTPIGLCGKYACRDVFYTLYLWLVHYHAVPNQFGEVYARDSQLQAVLHEMEWAGLPVNEAAIRSAHDLTGEQIRHWRKRLSELIGRDFDPTDDNLHKLFYDEYRYPPLKYTKSKAPSVDEEARKLLAAKHPECKPVVDALNALADVSKFHSTYSANFLRYISTDTGCIYPSYNAMGERKKGGVAVTGRLASQDPNIQNIPRDPVHLIGCRCKKCVGEGGVIGESLVVDARAYFTVEDGITRLLVDFGQIELRVLAWFTQDPNLLNAYHNGLDVHAMTEAMLSIDRPTAKQANFLTIYGGTEMALAVRMPGYFEDPDGTRARAKQILARFFEKYASIKQFEHRMAAQMVRNGCVYVSPFGRPRRLLDLRAPEEWIRAKARRKMMSSIVSGSSADLMKLAMLRTAPIAKKAGGALKKSIHDELVFDIPTAQFEAAANPILEAMTDWPIFQRGPEGFGRGIPIEAKAEITTTNWSEKKAFAKAIDGRVTRIG